ncbi:MAG TPA: MBL fold metallo-hydrolase [Anaerolineales bacterium]|nr:MBL fold metallo-hydrolase [Anaerolineales bacterium]
MKPERFVSYGGSRVYRLPLDLFPGLRGYAHLVLADPLSVLVDVGSGFGESNAQLEAGLEAVRSEFDERIGWGNLTHVVVTHGHIDHYGGLPFVRSKTKALVGVHELDRRVITHHEERLAVITPRLRQFLVEAGVEPEQREGFMDLYLMTKHIFASQPVDFTFEASGMRLGNITALHVPGHCPGQVVLRIDDVLLAGDLVLPNTSPHQSPEELTLYTGLGHYLESLRRLRPWAAGVRWCLGGHERAFENLEGRLEEIEALHAERLMRVHAELERPHTIAELAGILFPDTSGYHTWLALEETAAHVEYLLLRGALGLEEVDGGEAPSPRRYRQRGPLSLPLPVRASRPVTSTSPVRAARESAHGGIREERVDVRL